jgi:signal transduction histidine kinase
VSLRLKLYVGAVMIAAVVLLALHPPELGTTRTAHYLGWMLICGLGDAMWLRALSGDGSSSMGSTAGLATVILWGQGPSMWITALSTLLAELLVQKKPWVRAVFNASQIAITMFVAALVFALIGGPLGGLASLDAVPEGRAALRYVAPILGLFAGYLIVNRSLVAVAVAWSTERPYFKVLRDDWFYPDKLLADASAFLLAPLMVISFRAIDYFGVALFYAPLRMIHESTRRYNELQNAQGQLIHSERMAAKGEMAAEVGHELRNQLSAISGQAQMLLREADKAKYENVQRRAQLVLDQSRRMEALSKGLMDFSHSELTVERVDLNALIQRSIEFVRTQNRFDGIEWDMRLAEPAPELRADPGQLQQVLLNLFMNAADAMNEKPPARKAITVLTALDERARQVRVEVADTGPGIPPSIERRIFEPHFTTKVGGHGFGLSTSYRIITNHGGTITVASPPAGGARFTVALPQQRDGGWATGR